MEEITRVADEDCKQSNVVDSLERLRAAILESAETIARALYDLGERIGP